MNRAEIEDILVVSEHAARESLPLGPAGFWKAVSAVKKDPLLAEEFADRMGEIDGKAFANWALIRVPLGVGNALMILGTLAGLVLVGLSYSLEPVAAGWAFLLGLGVLLVTTHGLAHLVVGSLLGMGFTFWFIGSISRPQPGVKLEYSTYLRAPARSRAWMHASGVIVTKLVPWLLLGAAVAADLATWAILVTVATGVATLLTDIFLSTRFGEWRKVRREMGYAAD